MTGLSLTTGGIGSGEPVEFDAALNFADETSGLKAALAASAVVAAAANGAVTATDLERDRHASTPAAARPRASSTRRPTRIAFDREAETLAVEGLVDRDRRHARRVASSRAARCSRTRRVQGSVAVERAELATVFEQLRLAPPASLDAERARRVHARPRSSRFKPSRSSCS